MSEKQNTLKQSYTFESKSMEFFVMLGCFCIYYVGFVGYFRDGEKCCFENPGVLVTSQASVVQFFYQKPPEEMYDVCGIHNGLPLNIKKPINQMKLS